MTERTHQEAMVAEILAMCKNRWDATDEQVGAIRASLEHITARSDNINALVTRYVMEIHDRMAASDRGTAEAIGRCTNHGRSIDSIEDRLLSIEDDIVATKTLAAESHRRLKDLEQPTSRVSRKMSLKAILAIIGSVGASICAIITSIFAALNGKHP